MDVSLFPFAEYWWLYASFVGLVITLILLDLGVFHKTAHVVSFKEAAGWSLVWVTLALCFNYFLYRYCLWKFTIDPRLISLPGFDAVASARQVGLEFLTGYVIEKSLSVDNLFVFIVVFRFFGIEQKYQHRVLFFGLLGALVFRAIFIALGAILMQYQGVVIFFGLFLIFTGVKMFFTPEKPIEPEKNYVIRALKKTMPVTTTIHGQSFFVREGGRLAMTPLFIALVFLEMTDIVFAIDSVPAIFALTKEPFIVFTSNVFAILGLRSLYFLLSGAMSKFHLLKFGLAFVLMFVGLKMVWLNEFYGGKFPIGVSLAIIAGAIAGSVIASLLFPQPEEAGGSGSEKGN